MRHLWLAATSLSLTRPVTVHSDILGLIVIHVIITPWQANRIGALTWNRVFEDHLCGTLADMLSNDL